MQALRLVQIAFALACVRIAAALLTGAEDWSAERLHNGAPKLPAKFQAKIKMDIPYKYLQRPMLGLLHYDFHGQRTREDYYSVAFGHSERVFTSIRLFNEGKHYQIFHRVKDPALPSPRGCMITPIAAALPYPSVMQFAVYHGAKNMSLVAHSESGDEPLHDVFVNHWVLRFDNVTYDYYESLPNGRPVRLEAPGMNVTFIHFEPGEHTTPANLFVPEAVASTSCTPIGS